MSDESEDVKPLSLCRICLNSGVKMYMSIFEKYGGIAVNDYILLLTNVDIKKEDGLPDKICLNCFMEFETAVNFKLKCESSDTFFKTNKDKIIDVSAKTDVMDIIIIKKEEPYEEEIEFEKAPDDNTRKEYYGVEALKEISVGDVQPLKSKPVESYVGASGKISIHDVLSYKNKPVESDVVCNDCGDVFKSKCKLRVHWKKAHMLAYLVCEICKRQFKSYKSYCLHKEKSTKSCKVAGSAFVRIEGQGKSRVFHCNECNYKSSRLRDIETHTFLHSGEKPYSCSLCENRYRQHSSLVSHMESVHKQYLKDITCHFCGEQVKGRLNIYRHMLRHTDEKQPCTVCQKLYPKRLMTQHMLRHSGMKPCKCGECDATFYTLSELCNHRRRVHNKDKDEYKCDLCSFKSNRSERVKLHRTRHTDNNTPCTICGLFFETVEKMEAHQKQHNEEKSHKCPHCDLKFYRHKSISKHIRKKHKNVPTTRKRKTAVKCKEKDAKNDDNNETVEK